MFSVENDPEALASALYEVMTSGMVQLAGYHYHVGIDEVERTRLYLTSYLLPISSIHGLAWMTSNEQVGRVVDQASEIYLGRTRDQEQIVRAGDYVIWAIEREQVSRILRERFCDLISPALFESHQVRYGLLVRIVSEVRKEAQMKDLAMALRVAPNAVAGRDDVIRFIGLLGTNMAATFTKHILSIDPFAPPGSAQRIRYDISVANVTPFISHVYIETMNLVRQLED